MIEKQYKCIVIIYLSEKGKRHTRTFNEISLSDLFNSIDEFISEMKRKSFIPRTNRKKTHSSKVTKSILRKKRVMSKFND